MVQTTPTEPAALARRPDTAGPLAVATPTTRRLADASISLNTRRAYLGAAGAPGRLAGDRPAHRRRPAERGRARRDSRHRRPSPH